MKTIYALLIGLFFAAIAARAVNDPPLVINYQGKLLNSSGNAVTDGTYTIAFKLYGSSSGTTLLWGSSYSVVVAGGLFNVVLGEGGTAIGGAQTTAIATALGSTGTPFLGLTILVDNSGATINNPQEITPRLRLLSSPYSLVAENAKIADNAAYATNAGTVGGLAANQFLQPANRSATTIQGDLSVPNLGVNGGLTVANVANFQNNVAITGTLSAGATTGGGFVPIGGIIMWNGAANNVPSGWHLCDGTGGTPDLRGKFILGAGNTGSSFVPGNTGGSQTQTLGANNVPAHRHTFKDTVFSEAANVYDRNYMGNPEGYPGSDSTGYDSFTSPSGRNGRGANGSDTDNSYFWIKRYTDNQYGNASGGADAFSIMPPYYALAYIMRLQ
jgi:microcystin-dependent protein